MAYEQKDGSGALFRNDKRGNERAPDYRGDANVNGELVEIAAWIKEGKNGKFMSLSFKPKGDRPAPPFDLMQPPTPASRHHRNATYPEPFSYPSPWRTLCTCHVADRFLSHSLQSGIS